MEEDSLASDTEVNRYREFNIGHRGEQKQSSLVIKNSISAYKPNNQISAKG